MYYLWRWEYLYDNPRVTVDALMAHPEIASKWNLYGMSDNINTNMDTVLKYNYSDWAWWKLSKHPNITADDILHHPELPWEWDNVSDNPNLTMDVIKRYPDKSWDWRWIPPSSHETSRLPMHTTRSVFSVYDSKQYMAHWLCKYSVISMHDEDYDRGEECLDYDNVVDLVIQNIFCISSILEYIY